MALRQWNRVALKVNAGQNARFVASTIANELRQGVPSPDPAKGYLAIKPAISPTAVLMPNANTKSSSQIEFTEPHPTDTKGNWTPMKSGWVSTSPANYRNVIYRVQGLDVIRENRPNNGDAPTQEVITSAGANGSIELSFTSLTSNTVDIKVKAREGQGANSYTAEYTTTCFLVGQ